MLWKPLWPISWETRAFSWNYASFSFLAILGLGCFLQPWKKAFYGAFLALSCFLRVGWNRPETDTGIGWTARYLSCSSEIVFYSRGRNLSIRNFSYVNILREPPIAGTPTASFIFCKLQSFLEAHLYSMTNCEKSNWIYQWLFMGKFWNPQTKFS